ncbi:MAG: hypothetical protein Q8L41_11975 [Anaerolineales bacterium]|nr:hypothetical protein [Anaerolineales bacterium]
MILISGLAYLLFIPKFGYFNDDWYLMYAAGAKGPAVFWDIFSIDRPLRALVMIPAYTFFGADPLYYNLSAFLFRLLGGLSFLWILRMVWPGKNRMTLWMAILFLLYPGFLSQPNAIDYLSHLAGLAAGMLSIGLTLQAVQSNTWKRKALFYLASILLGWFYLGQIEWYIGLEFFRFACIFLLAFRLNETIWVRAARFFQYSLPVFLIPGVFLAWRLFYFKSERGATDVDLQLTDMRAEPLKFLFNYSSALLNDFFDVLLHAWWLPLRRLSAGMTTQEWMPGFGIAFLVLLLVWIFSGVAQGPGDVESGQRSVWRRELIWVGLGALVFGLFPVILVGRTVDFKNFSRYTLIASIGAVLLWQVVLSYISSLRLRNALFGILIVSASLTHYANGFVKARETEATRNFWWQVSWRIPQINPGATLVTHYTVVAEEDYFTWGPANLLYHPESDHEKYVQPAVYAVVLNEKTVAKVLAHEPQDYSNRRSIRTYPNYRNILIFTQPTPASCVQVIDLHQVELSSAEDLRVTDIAPYSEADQIALNESFHVPPAIPFGLEPPNEWCYYYEKASYARQLGDWDEVLRLGEEAISRGFIAKDQIEWMPFLQAYAYSDYTVRLNELASFMTSDLPALQQACHTLTAMPLAPNTLNEISHLFCIE